MLGCVVCSYCFCFVLCILPLLFCKVVLLAVVLMWIVRPQAILEIHPTFCICVLFIPNSIFLFCTRNTLGHIGLIYFVPKFFEPQSLGTLDQINLRYTKPCYLFGYPERRRSMGWRSFSALFWRLKGSSEDHANQ